MMIYALILEDSNEDTILSMFVSNLSNKVEVIPFEYWFSEGTINAFINIYMTEYTLVLKLQDYTYLNLKFIDNE